MTPRLTSLFSIASRNERLFKENYKAFAQGRGEKEDPSDTWYESELSFFDDYVIPLACKLADSGVFGVSSNEYMMYALENRKQWAVKGRDIVQDLALKVKV